jgi:hypothetical protein
MKIRTDGTPLTQFHPGDDSLRDLTFDGTHVWAVNTFGTLRRFTVDGELVDTIGGLLSSGAWGLTYDPEGYMWVSNQLTDSLYMISSPEAVAEAPGMMPSSFSLSQNAPNPFVSRTQISYSLSQEGPVSLDVFDASGARIRTLVDDRIPAGAHTSTWDGTDDGGNRTPSGVYFYRLKTGDGLLTRRMIHLPN